jgi:CheY-like chemotaxis protein
MPEMNGYQLLAQITDPHLRDTPVIMISLDEMDGVVVHRDGRRRLSAQAVQSRAAESAAGRIARKTPARQPARTDRKFATDEVADELLTTVFARRQAWRRRCSSATSALSTIAESPADTIGCSTYYALMMDPVTTEAAS